MRRRFGTDALESIPLKLIIVAIVASMSVVPAAQALVGLEGRELVRRAEMQLDKVVTVAQVLTVQGPGNVRTLEMDFRSGTKLSFLELRAGDRLGGPNASSAILVLSNGGIMTRIARAPECSMCSTDLTAFVAYQPLFDLRMTAVLDNRTTVVMLEMV